MTHCPSDAKPPPTTRYGAVAIIVLLLGGIGLGGFGALVTTDRYIVTEDETVTEDQYVTAVSTSVEGTIDGDLTVFAGSVTISGTVTGSVTVLSSGTITVTPTGRIGGSLDGAAAALSLQGDVGDDVFLAAGSIVVEPTADVGRDVILFGGSARVEGIVGRDVRGRAVRLAIDGRVRGDVDVATSILTIGPTALISGDVLYRSSSDANIAEEAVITGTVTKLPAQSNFIYGIILSLANLIGFLAFVVAGLLALWLLRGIGSRATGAVLTKPIRTLLTGIAAVIVLPLAVVLMAITLVGIPIAIALVALAIVLFIVGAVPAVTALGNLVLVRRGGLFGAFLVGAVLWRLGIWLLPWVGGAVFVLGLVWGTGGWIVGAIAARRAEPIPAPLLPATMVAATDRPPEWVPPRAPTTAAPVAVVDSAAVVEASASSDPDEPGEPDPTVERDRRADEEPISFGDASGGSEDDPDGRPSTGSHPDDGVPGGEPGTDDGETLDDRLAAFRTELEATTEAESDGETGDDLSRRFRELRDEVATGSVEPAEPKPDPFDVEPDETDSGGSDWGLPER